MLKTISQISQYTEILPKNTNITALSEKYNVQQDELKMLNDNKTNFKKGDKIVLPVETEKLRETFRKMIKKDPKKNLQKLHKIKLFADRLFYIEGEQTGLLDWQYDTLKEFLEENSEKYKPPVGAKLREGENRIELPFWLGSMDKYKPKHSKEIEKWVHDHNSKEYLIESKLDGVSCLLEYNNGSIKMYTRGDGNIGADISNLSVFFDSVPKDIEGDLSVRGELIMKKKTFEKKYSDQYANARNLVAGRIGAKKVKQGISDIDFVVYEIVGEGLMETHLKQMKYLEKLGFLTPRRKIVKTINVPLLSKNLIEFKEKSPYEIDGIIIQPVQKYKRNIDGNPSYAFAFKMRLAVNLRETEVEKVVWSISKWGQIKPRIKIKQVNLGGTKIDYVTGFNAKYIDDNKIGPGAVIKITRSGDVIPHIVEVVKKAKKAQMPEVEYEWNNTKVDIIAKNGGDIKCIKLIHSFFAKLGVKHLGEATVKKMYQSGLDNIMKIVKAKKSDFLKIDGIEDKGATRLYDNIQKGLKNVEIDQVLGSSQVFGFGVGSKRIKVLFQAHPNILQEYKKMSASELLQRVKNVEGFDIMALNVAENLKYADDFVQKLKKAGVQFKTKKVLSEKLKGKKIVFSGFRDKELQEKIEQNHGRVTSSISKTTSYLVVKEITSVLTGKSKKAQELGVPIISKKDFINTVL
jgi:NAD-dependent DNA ligase